MMRSLFSAVSGMKSHQTGMDVIGNNVANVNTTGYKGSRVIFQDIFSQTLSSATAPTTSTGGINAKQIGLGVSISTIGMNMTEGSTQSTSYPLDFAIAGDGFFVVDTGAGQYYTRNGAFTLDADGYLVNANGDYVMAVISDSTDSATDPTNLANTSTIETDPANAGYPQKIKLSGTMTIGTDTVTCSDYAIDANGAVTAVATLDVAGVSTKRTVTLGRLVLATVDNAAGLEKVGSSYYSTSANSGEANVKFANNNCGKLSGGSLEMSNVDLATELTNMIIMQRGFQSNSRVITTSDSMLEELVNLKR